MKSTQLFSFDADEKFLAQIPLQHIELGLEIAALEERHAEACGSDADQPVKLMEQFTNLRKLREARAELQQGLASSEAGERNYALDRYTTRLLRAAFEAGRRHDPEQSDTRLDELVDLLRRKIHIGVVTDDVLTSGGTFARRKTYWTQAQVDAAKQIVRTEYAPEYTEISEAGEGGLQDA